MKNKGFTLIEIMVVIAILSLISSIILSSLNSAREKAASSKYRQEVGQFIKALELYYDTHDQYPNQGAGGISLSKDEYGAIADSGSIVSGLNPFLSDIPTPVKDGLFVYYNPLLTGTSQPYRCIGHTDSTPPAKYVILINSTESAFSDWPYGEQKNYSFPSKLWTGSGSTYGNFFRCYSVQ